MQNCPLLSNEERAVTILLFFAIENDLSRYLQEAWQSHSAFNYTSAQVRRRLW